MNCAKALLKIFAIGPFQPCQVAVRKNFDIPEELGLFFGYKLSNEDVSEKHKVLRRLFCYLVL